MWKWIGSVAGAVVFMTGVLAPVVGGLGLVWTSKSVENPLRILSKIRPFFDLWFGCFFNGFR